MNFDINTVIQRITDTITTKTVVGEPIQVGKVTLIPIMNVSFGFGAGSGDGKNNGNDQGSGAGGGGGARLSAAGMIVIKDDEVSFMPTGKTAGIGGSIEKILDAVPDLIEKLKGKVPRENADEKDAAE